MADRKGATDPPRFAGFAVERSLGAGRTIAILDELFEKFFLQKP